jgi:hypothetical protein
MDISSSFVCLSRIPHRLPQVPLVARPVGKGEKFDVAGIELLALIFTRYTPALGSSGGRHRILEEFKGQN